MVKWLMDVLGMATATGLEQSIILSGAMSLVTVTVMSFVGMFVGMVSAIFNR